MKQTQRGEHFVPKPLDIETHEPIQLPMFMDARNLRASITGTLDRSYDDPEEVLEDKLTASKKSIAAGHGGGVYDSVKKVGVLSPVQLVHADPGNLMLGQGHHRVAAAADISETTGQAKWVPIIHTDASTPSSGTFKVRGREHPIATERQADPIDIYSSRDEKVAALRDHHEWSMTTEAFGTTQKWLDLKRRRQAGK